MFAMRPVLSVIVGRLPAALLCCALMSLARAQAPDFDAVSARLIEAVQAGELTPHQAEAMMAELGRAAFGERMRRALGDAQRGGARHDRGEPDRQAAEMAEQYRKLGIEEPTIRRIVARLHESGLDREQVHKAMGGMLRIVHRMRAEGQDYEMDPRLRRYFEESGFDGEQIQTLQGISRRMAQASKQQAPPDKAAKPEQQRKQQAQQKPKQKPKQNKSARQPDPDQRQRRAEFEKILRRTSAAVADGTMSEEEAGQKLRAARRRLFGEPRPQGGDRPPQRDPN